MPDDAEPTSRSRFTETSLFVGLGAAVSFAIVVIAGLAIMAAGMTDADSSAGSRSGGSVDGASLYEENCATCHGEDGEGGVGPTMVGIADKYPDVSLQVLVVEEGRNAMPSFKSRLSSEQIEAVVAYEREAFHDAGTADAEAAEAEADE